MIIYLIKVNKSLLFIADLTKSLKNLFYIKINYNRFTPLPIVKLIQIFCRELINLVHLPYLNYS